MFISKRRLSEMERRISNIEKEVSIQKGKNSSGIDTSIAGFEYVGIKLTEQQYEDLVDLNIVLMGDGRKYIPVFNTMLLLKILGLIPKEMMIESNLNSGEDVPDSIEQYHRRFGRPRE